MKHHYVPVFYQKHFVGTDELLWVYDRQTRTYKPLHPLSICFQHDLYAMKIEGELNQIVEKEFLARADGASSSAFRKLPTLLHSADPEVLHAIAYFASLQYLRVPCNKPMISMIYEAGADDFLEVAFGTIEHATASLERYSRDTGKPLNTTPEAMVEAVQSKSFKARATEMPFVTNIVRQADEFAEVFWALDFQLLISPPQTGFIVSDNPVTLVPPPGNRNAGIHSPRAFTFIPLTRSFCMSFGPRGSGVGPREIDRETVRYINQNTAINSDRFVMGPSQIQLESVIRRSDAGQLSHEPRWTTTKVVDEKGGITRGLHAQQRRLHHIYLGR
jgi:hypothetical protein